MTRERFEAAVRRLGPLYDEVGVAAPVYPERFAPSFESQAEAVLAARPAAFSMVFGVPDERVLAAFRDAGIVTLGTATTPDEAVALDEAGIDIVVASGAEAGGHRGAFLAAAEESLVGTLPLVRIAVEEVQVPVIAAGGIADARGIAAALALGAEGVQIGTAFLATDESGASAAHKAALLGGARRTTLTRAFSGRLARGIPNRLTDGVAFEPFPYQSYLLRPILQAARTDLVAMWCGQGAPLLTHRSAADLFAALADGTDQTPDYRKRHPMTIAAIPFTESFTADPDHSSFQAQLRHMGVGVFRTGFTDVEARLEVGPGRRTSDRPRPRGLDHDHTPAGVPCPRRRRRGLLRWPCHHSTYHLRFESRGSTSPTTARSPSTVA